MAAISPTFVPDEMDDVTPEWLSEVLGHSVTSLTIEPLDSGIGFIGRTARVRMRLDGNDRSTTVVVKLPGPEGPARTIGNAGAMYEREARFYGEIAPVVGIRVPAPLAVRMDLDRQRFALVLEDLAPARPGDQLAGITEEEAFAAVDAAARLHAGWWARLGATTWPWLPRPAQASAAFRMGPVDVADFEEAMGPQLDEDRIRTTGLVSTRLPALLAAAVDPPHTLVHGDYRLDNLLFDDDGVVVADWQLVAAASDGAADLVLLLASSFDAATRHALTEPLLDFYRERLRAGGVDLTADELRAGLQRACGVCVARMIAAHRIPSANDRAREMRRRMYEGYWDLAERFDLAEALLAA